MTELKSPTRTVSISSCVQCAKHLVVPDPDREDWFNADDVAVLCTEKPLVGLTSNKNRVKFKVVSSADRPYQVTVSNMPIPAWCPLSPLKE